MSDYSKADIRSEAAIYAEGTRFTTDELVEAWNSHREDDERLQDFFERFLEPAPPAIDMAESQAARQWLLDSIPEVVIAANDENNAEKFWSVLDERFQEIAKQVRRGNTTIDMETWKAIQQLEGFSDGPSYAKNALIVVDI